MKYFKWLSGLFLVGILLAPTADAQINPKQAPNNSWISISGKIKFVSRDSFILDYGKGLITVEMDDADQDSEAYNLETGDQVVVKGKIDADYNEGTSIEASSVYVKNLGAYFYADSADEEEPPVWSDNRH